MKKTKIKAKKIKADDFVKYEEIGEEMNFTNFEEIQIKVEVLQESLNEIVEILRANELVRQETIEANYFDDDEVYKRLEDD